MRIELLDPATMTAVDWPNGESGVRSLTEAIHWDGSAKFVSNLRTRMLVLRDGDFLLPLTVNNSEDGRCYLNSMHAYLQYMKDELKVLGNEFVQRSAALCMDGAAAIIRRAQIDKVIQINDWLFSTNPYPKNWAPNADEITAAVTAAYPDHFIVFGSLTKWANSGLMTGLKRAGYTLGSYRQVYVYDHLEKTYFSHEHVKRDRRLLRLTTYRIIQNDEIEEADYPRIAELYAMLYLRKHSQYNPSYTAEFMRLFHRTGLIRFIGLRNGHGRLDGITGLQMMSGAAPVSAIVGYDTSIDRKIGLFRMVMALIFEAARAEGRNVNLSAGNADFKRHRGGQPIIEYRATYARHLSLGRQLALEALARSANLFLAPAMKLLEV